MPALHQHPLQLAQPVVTLPQVTRAQQQALQADILLALEVVTQQVQVVVPHQVQAVAIPRVDTAAQQAVTPVRLVADIAVQLVVAIAAQLLRQRQVMAAVVEAVEPHTLRMYSQLALRASPTKA